MESHGNLTGHKCTNPVTKTMAAMQFLPTWSLPMFVLLKVVSTDLPQLEIIRKSIQKSNAK